MSRNEKILFTNSLTAKGIEKEKTKASAIATLKTMMKSPAALKSNRVRNPIHRLSKKIHSGVISENEAILAVLEHYDYHGRTHMVNSERVGGDSSRKVLNQ
jgi:uncharacterized protein (DUF2252 family)